MELQSKYYFYIFGRGGYDLGMLRIWCSIGNWQSSFFLFWSGLCFIGSFSHEPWGTVI